MIGLPTIASSRISTRLMSVLFASAASSPSSALRTAVVSSTSPPSCIITYETRLMRSSPKRICGFITPGAGKDRTVQQVHEMAGDRRRPDIDGDAERPIVEARPDRDDVAAAVDRHRDPVAAGRERRSGARGRPTGRRAGRRGPIPPAARRTAGRGRRSASRGRARSRRPCAAARPDPCRRPARRGPCARPACGPGSRAGRR